MNATEFALFMQDACSTFPGLKTYFSMRPGTRDLIQNSWRAALSNCDAELAARAVEAFIDRVDELAPNGEWRGFPSIVVRYCNARPEARYLTRCHLCGGDGIVEVGSTGRIYTIANNELRTFEQNGELLWGPFGAACPCTVGQALNGKRAVKLPDYNRQHMRQFRQSFSAFQAQVERAEKEARAAMRQATMSFD